MSRITWGAPAERFYETGVDRGVFYPQGGFGVAWNGLASVSESPTGGEAKPAYIDGVKFRNLASSEEFEATITAFGAPAEFGVCDGTATIHNGLFATQQPRKSFNLTYRTKVENAVGVLDAYKIHFVFNALAAPAGRDHTTLSDSLEAMSLSWSLTTLPPPVSGIKPTAHFIVDSRYTDPFVLSDVEDHLYGSNDLPPQFPTYDELVGFFATTYISGGDADDTDPIVYDGGSPSSTFTTYIDGGSL